MNPRARILRTTKYLAASAVIAIAAATPATAAWQPPSDVALDADPAAHARSSAPASVGGVPHVAWTEGTESASSIRAARMRPDGTWEPLGGPPTAPGSLAIEPAAAAIGDAFYVAWAERPSGGVFQVRVARLTASGWEQAGGIVNRDADVEARDPSLADLGGVPHVAWTESDAQNIEVRVARLSAGSWEQVGGLINRSSREAEAALIPSLVDQYGAFEPDLAVVGGVLHVGFHEGTESNGDARVARFMGGAWTEYGAGQPLGSSAIKVDVASVGGVPFAAWREASGKFVIRLARLEGGAWDTSTAELASSANAEPALLEAGGRAWMAYVAPGDDVRVTRLTEDAATWAQPVDAALDDVRTNTTRSPALFALDGIPWVAWSEGILSSRQDVRVSRLVPEFLDAGVTAAGTSATLTATLRTFGLSYPAGFAYGLAGSELAARTALAPAAGEQATIAATVTGLSPRTAYEFQPLAVAGPEVRGPVMGFTTTKRNAKD